MVKKHFLTIFHFCETVSNSWHAKTDKLSELFTLETWSICSILSGCQVT